LVLDSVSLAVSPGEFVAVIGPSGCGKTTLLRMLGGLVEPDRGTVLIGGAGPEMARNLKDIGFVFQDPALLPWRNVAQNIRLPLEINGGPKNGERGHGDAGAEQLMDAVGLGDFASYYPHQLSGGMRQRVALARAFAFDPALLLMDEPFGSLDEITREAMRYELLALWEATGKTVVFVTHSVPEAAVLADRVVVMSDRPGRVVADISVDFPRPRDAAVERSSGFLELTSRIREALSAGAGGR
jgi:NitT/TauT family transport system ATP-binding protein